VRILLTNDDGVHAPGLEALETIARELSDDIWICAPSEEASGAGHSLTLNQPVRLRELGERRFCVTGTPTDAVNLALRKVLPARPDLVLSGVNRGENLGDDITYSGTVSAALEAALAGIRAVALSQATLPNDHGFAAALGWGARVLRPLIEAPHSERTLINVNFPPLPAGEVKGIRVVRQGFHAYSRGSVVEGTDPRGRRYFWFGLDDIEHTPDHETDLEAVRDGYVAVTPLQLDLTHYPSLGLLGERY
jgi:5'-nucleotidase